MRNALTIDVEDWYHPELVQQHLPAGSPAGQVQESTGALLALLRQRGIKPPSLSWARSPSAIQA